MPTAGGRRKWNSPTPRKTPSAAISPSMDCLKIRYSKRLRPRPTRWPNRSRGKIIDYVGGLDDLRAGVIRAIGDPEARFSEDFLRLLRAVRFASVLGFALEPRTAAAIIAQAPNLSRISRERVGQEMRRMFDPAEGNRADPARAARMIQELHLDAPILHEDHAQPALPTLERLMIEPWRAEATFPASLAAWALDRQWPAGLSPAASGPTPASDLRAAVEQWLSAGLAPLLRRCAKRCV